MSVLMNNKTVTGSHTVGSEYVVNVNAGTATITIPELLPIGTRKLIRKISSTAGTITISRSGSDVFTKDSLTSVTIAKEGDFYILEKISATQWDVTGGWRLEGSTLSVSSNVSVGGGTTGIVHRRYGTSQPACLYSDGDGSGISDFDGGFQELVYMRPGSADMQFYTNSASRMIIDSSGNVGIGTTDPQGYKLRVAGNVKVDGSLSKGSGSFRIDHPLKPDTNYLVHSFVEAPKADLFYSGMVTLVGGKAEIDIDEAEGMTPGTFGALCRTVRRFTTNESGFTRIKSKIDGSKLTIIAEDETCTDEIFWMVIGERKDKHMYNTEWTDDDDGRVIVEPEKNVIAEPEEN